MEGGRTKDEVTLERREGGRKERQQDTRQNNTIHQKERGREREGRR